MEDCAASPSQGEANPLYVFREEMRAWLKTVIDEGTSIDSGGGLGGMDLWPTIGGEEFYINIRLRPKE